MKKIIIASLLLGLFGISAVSVTAQTKKKKKSGSSASASSKKKKKKKKGEQETAATAPAADTAKAPVAMIDPDDTATNPLTRGLIADSVADNLLSFAVLDTTKPTDGFYKSTTLIGAKPFAFPKEDKNNIKFYKRIWRVIDLHDSVNKIFAVHGETMYKLIIDAIKADKLVPYRDAQFKKTYTYAKVLKMMTDSSDVPIQDPVTGEMTGTVRKANDFNFDSVTKYEIVEDIYFDKIRGRVITQIVSLSPKVMLKTTTGADAGEQHIFYLSFPQCRQIFAGKEVIDPQRDIYNESLDDIFIQRMFKSQIIKESNPADLSIAEKYPDNPAKQKEESDRIEREIKMYKKNLWRY